MRETKDSGGLDAQMAETPHHNTVLFFKICPFLKLCKTVKTNDLDFSKFLKFDLRRSMALSLSPLS